MAERSPGFTAADGFLLVIRGIWILLAVSLSCFFAGFVAAIGFKAMTQGTGILTELSALSFHRPGTLVAAFGVGFVFTRAVGLPAFLFAAVAAAQGWRGLFVFLALGFALGLVTPLAYFGFEGINPGELPIFASAGAAGGFLYWLIAGSWVGRSRLRPPASEEA